MHRLATLIFLLTVLSASAQEANRAGVRYRVVYTPNDYFAQVSCVVAKPKFQSEVFLGLGIARTFFQGRLFPEIGFQYTYLTTNQPFRVLPYAQMSFSRLRITDASAHYWWNNELGVKFELHRKRDIGLQLGYRNMIEFWRYKKQGLNTMGFGFSGGIYFKV